MATLELRLLSDSNIQELHDTSMRILECIGLRVPSREVLDLLQGQPGISVDQDRAIARQEAILDEHTLDRIDEDVARELDAIVTAAHREMLGS